MTFSIHPAMERTLSFVKPDAFRNKDEIKQRYQQEGLKIVAADVVCLSVEDAKAFYETHKNKPFFDSLVNFIASGPIYVMILEGSRAVSQVREIMGATDPIKADRNTIRALYGANIDRNAVHGSDSFENAQREIAFFSKINAVFQANVKH